MRYDLYHNLMTVSDGPTADPTHHPYPQHAIQLVALDIDGTLLKNDGQLSPNVIQTINNVTATGIPVILITARPPSTSRRFHEEVNLAPLQVNFDGAYICDGIQPQPLQHLSLTPDLALNIINIARLIDPTVKIRVDAAEHWYTDRNRDVPQGQSPHQQPKAVQAFEDCITEDITRLSFLGPAQNVKRIRETVNNKFGDLVTLPYSDQRLLQIIHPKAGKAAALKYVADHLGIPQKNTLAIGDGPNDRSMINWAGWGVALDNAWTVVKAAANAIVPSNEEDGVAYALSQFVLNENPTI